ncbi:MAG TPA: hypothetical protein PKZ32_07740 [Candidatus Melainabacteria bacterium]|nr:hypothetical protein [Candidatus Melainabacteria bacterium]
MSPFDKVTSQADFENTAEFAQEHQEHKGLQEISLADLRPAPADTTNAFSISHQNPELHSVMQATEILNVSHNELSACAIDAQFLKAQEELVSHFQLKLSGLPEEMQASVLESLNLQPKYGHFPLFAQIVKSSLA